MKVLKLAVALATLICFPGQPGAVPGDPYAGTQCQYYSWQTCSYKGDQVCNLGAITDPETNLTTTYASVDYADSTASFPYKNTSNLWVMHPAIFAWIYNDPIPNGPSAVWNYELSFGFTDLPLGAVALYQDTIRAKLAVKSLDCSFAEVDEYTEVEIFENMGFSPSLTDIKTTPVFRFVGRIEMDDGDCFGPMVRVGFTSGPDVSILPSYFRVWNDKC